MPEELLTSEDVAKLLKLNVQTVSRLAREGEIPSIEIGGVVRFKPSDLDEYMSRKRRPAKAK